jgi:DNA polymerase III subunit delta'
MSHGRLPWRSRRSYVADVDTTERSGAPPHAGYGERYPWHTAPWEMLTRDLARLPHALLLHGAEGLGKRSFAWRLTQAMLCATAGEPLAACGRCNSCSLFIAGTHPDLLSIAPLEDSKAIAVDQVREVKQFLALTPHTAARKVVIVDPADAMNLNAANALLKVLEEPPPGSLLVLVTARPGRLPATIRSRANAVTFRLPAHEEALAWLKKQGVADPETYLVGAGGAPLRALANASSTNAAPDPQQLQRDVEALRAGKEDPLRCAARWKTAGTKLCVEWFQRYITALIRSAGGFSGTNNDVTFPFVIKDLFKFLDVISDIKFQLDSPLDETLMLEDMLITWCRISRRIG